jgi:hypothetical protein
MNLYTYEENNVETFFSDIHNRILVTNTVKRTLYGILGNKDIHVNLEN